MGMIWIAIEVGALVTLLLGGYFVNQHVARLSRRRALHLRAKSDLTNKADGLESRKALLEQQLKELDSRLAELRESGT